MGNFKDGENSIWGKLLNGYFYIWGIFYMGKKKVGKFTVGKNKVGKILLNQNLFKFNFLSFKFFKL